MRIAVAGSHNTGKSTLIAAFVALRPRYLYEPEAYEMLADDIALTAFEGPTPEGLQSLLDLTIAGVASHAPGACVVFERSPVDYLAYAAASRASWPSDAVADFLKTQVPVVRAAMHHLDRIVFLPVSGKGPISSRADEDDRFRRRVDERLRRALIDDDYDLFGGAEAPRVVELSPPPERQLAELLRLVGDKDGCT
jgi:hypothetical protein